MEVIAQEKEDDIAWFEVGLFTEANADLECLSFQCAVPVRWERSMQSGRCALLSDAVHILT